MAPKNPKNRDNILDTAARLFAENGFDATSMNSLALEASVNKALVYYYFKDKDDILRSLFELLVKRMRIYAQADQADLNDKKSVKRKIGAQIDFLKENQNTLSLMLMESLKSGKQPNLLVEVVHKVIEAELVSRGFPDKPKSKQEKSKHKEAMVHEFFTGIMPVLVFVVLGDPFAGKLNITSADCRELFLNAIQISHFDSHVNSAQ